MQSFLFLLIDWKAFLMGEDRWEFLIEVALRTFAMFLVILFSLRILGKRSITQLSVFELGVIIGLGSAAGDPMFYKDVGLLPGMVVFAMVISLYRATTYIINKNDKVEKLLEGEPVYLAREGKILVNNFRKEPIAHEEFFAMLRQHAVSHLGQVKYAIIETNGTLSIYYFEDNEVKHGLPVLPHHLQHKTKEIPKPGLYACTCCGYLYKINEEKKMFCPECDNEEWVKAINDLRIK